MNTLKTIGAGVILAACYLFVIGLFFGSVARADIGIKDTGYHYPESNVYCTGHAAAGTYLERLLEDGCNGSYSDRTWIFACAEVRTLVTDGRAGPFEATLNHMVCPVVRYVVFSGRYTFGRYPPGQAVANWLDLMVWTGDEDDSYDAFYDYGGDDPASKAAAQIVTSTVTGI